MLSRLVPPESRPLVIGHRGAASVAPENSLEGFAAGIAAGADLIEFDVSPGLLIGHPGVRTAGPRLTLDEALAYLAATPVGLHLDLKLAGAEREIADALERHGLAGRAVVTATWTRSIRRLGAVAPDVSRAITYPRDRYGASSIRWPGPVVRSSSAALRATMRSRVPLLLARARADAVALHHALVSATVVGVAHARGAPVIAWTVNDPTRIAQLARAGVDAIVSDDPAMAVSVLATLKSHGSRGLETSGGTT